MELTIQRSDLLKGLQRVQGVVDSKKAIPILSNILVEMVEDGIWIYATDLEVGIKGFYPCATKKPGSFTVPARKLFDLTRELPEGTITISSDEPGAEDTANWLKIICNRYESRLAYMSAELYPSFPSYGDEYIVSFEPKVLRDMIRKTIFSVATDETRLALNGTLLEIAADSVTMVSTDTHRLSYIQTNCSPKSNEGDHFILSRKTSAELLKFIDDGEEAVLFSVYENQAIFRKGNLILVSRLLQEGQFPDYRGVMPSKFEREVLVDKEALAHTLKRVSVMSDERSSVITLKLREGEIELISQAAEIGEAKEVLDVKYKGEPITIGINSKYILDILATVEEDKMLLLLNGPGKPVILTPAGDDSSKFIVMPIYVPSDDSEQ
ncbi:MAG: DNA polymerase III subunit beta [Nitrospinota bacterium]|nr:DNA polymerase III subunit beta [Nitrospinota bacterium]